MLLCQHIKLETKCLKSWKKKQKERNYNRIAWNAIFKNMASSRVLENSPQWVVIKIKQ